MNLKDAALEESDEENMDGDHVPESFVAKDSRGRSVGMNLGEIKNSLRGQHIDMAQLRRNDPQLYEQLRRKYGGEVDPAKLSATELLKLEESGMVRLPENSLSTLNAAKEIEAQALRSQSENARIIGTRDQLYMDEI